MTLGRLSYFSDGCFLDDSFLDGCFLHGLLVILLLWVSQKTTLQQNSLGRNWMPRHFGPPPRVTGTPPWLLRLVKDSTSSELYPDTRLFFLCEYLGIQFFNSHSHVTYRMPCHARGHSHSYLGKWRISLGLRSILSISLCSHT